jgi:signal transduction histidine kinase
MQSRAQGMGGRLTLASAPGKGTTVQVTLPRELPWRDAPK